MEQFNQVILNHSSGVKFKIFLSPYEMAKVETGKYFIVYSLGKVRLIVNNFCLPVTRLWLFAFIEF